MTDVGSVSIGVDVNAGDLGEKLAARIREAVLPAIAEMNRELDSANSQIKDLDRGTGIDKIIAQTHAAASGLKDMRDGATEASVALDKIKSDEMVKLSAAARKAATAVKDVGQNAEKAAVLTHAAADKMVRDYDRVADAADRSAQRQIEAAAAVAAANRESSNAGRNPGFGVATPRNGGGGGGGGGGFIGGLVGNPAILNGAALASTAVAPLALATVNLIGTIQELAGAAGVLPGIFAGGAASLGTAKIATLGMSDALKTLFKAAASGNPKDLKKAQDALQGLAPAAKDTVGAIASLVPALKDVQQATQQNVFDGISQPLKDVAAKDLPIFKTGLTQIGTAWNGTIKSMLAAAGSDSTGGFLTKIFGNTAVAQTQLNAAIAPIVHAVGTLTSASSDFLPRLATGLDGLATRADDFITKLTASGQLDVIINKGIDSAKELGTSFLNVGKILNDLTQAAGGGGGFLKALEDGTTKLHAFLSSTDGQNKLKGYFDQARQEFEQIKPILGDLARGIGQVFDGLHQYGAIASPIFGGLLDFLVKTPGLLSGLSTSFIAFRTIGGILDKFGGSAATAASGVDGLLGKVKTLSGLQKGGVLVGGALALDGVNGLADPKQQDGGSQALNAAETVGGGALAGFAVGGPFGALIGGAAGAGAALYTFLNQVGDVSTQLKRQFDKDHEGLTDPTKPSFLNAAPNNFNPDAPPGTSRPPTRLPDQLREFINSGKAPPGFSTNPDGTITGPNGQVLPGLNVAPFVPPPPLPTPPIVRNPPTVVPQPAPTGAVAPTNLSGLLGAPPAPPPGAGASVPGLDVALKSVNAVKTAITSLPPGKVDISDNTTQVKAALGDVANQTKSLPPGNVKVSITDNASAALATIKSNLASLAAGVTVPVYTSGIAAGAAPTAGPGSGIHGAGHASGGVFPGYAPGIDSLWARVSPGEGVLIPEAVKALGGSRGVYGINSMFRSGLSRSGYRSGGVVPGDPSSGQGLGPLPGPGAVPGDSNSVIGLLTQIRDLLAGRGAVDAPLKKTASGIDKLTGAPGATGVGGKSAATGAIGPFGTPLKPHGTPAYEMAAAAIQALGGDPERFLGTDPALTSTALGGTAAGGATNPDAIAALTQFAQTGTAVPGVDLTSPVAKAILAARNKKKGGLSDDAISGLVNSTLTTGTFSGQLDPTNTSLVEALLKAAPNVDGVAPTLDPTTGKLTKGARAAAATAIAPGPGGAVPPAGTIGATGSIQAVYVVNFPGQPNTSLPGLPPGANVQTGVGQGGGAAAGPDGATNYAGKSVVDAAFSATGGVASNVAGQVLEAITSSTDLKTGAPTRATTPLTSLIQQRNPLAGAALFGLNVPDYSRDGGQDNPVMSNPQKYDAEGHLFGDTAATSDRTNTDSFAQLKASIDQVKEVINQVKDNTSKDVLEPLMKDAVTAGISAMSDATNKAIGNAQGTAAAGPIAGAVAKVADGAYSAGQAAGAAQANNSTDPTGGAVGTQTAAAGQNIIGNLFDEGGLWESGTYGTNLSGSVERVLNPVQTALFDQGKYGGWNLQPMQQHMATQAGVDVTSTVGADFFGVSQVPIIGALVNLLVGVFLKLIGVTIDSRDTLNEMADNVRQFRGDFQKFDASGRLYNDTSGLLDRSGSSQQEATDERVNILKQVLQGLVEFIINQILVPIGKAVANAAIQAGGAAAGAAINSQAPGAGGIVSSFIDSAGEAGVGIAGDLVTEFTNAATPALFQLIQEGLQTYFPGILKTLFSGGLAADIANPITSIFSGVFGTLTSGVSGLLGGGLAGVLSSVLGGLALFDDGGMAEGVGLMPKATIRPERVLSPNQTALFERMVSALEGGGRGGNNVTLHAPITVASGGKQAANAAHASLLALLGA